MKRLLIISASILATILIISGFVLADAYIIGPEDMLEISFWQDNNLDAMVKVRQDGKISLDIIGEIEAAGLTTSELEKKIVRQMSRFNKAISHAVVRVTDYGYQKVYITGQVLNPGKYTFEKIPDILTLINETGGISEFGDLSRVLIVRGGEDSGKVETVDVAGAVASGKIDQLPKVYTGETIEVPRVPAGLQARAISDQSSLKKIYYVSGEVNRPGALSLETGIDILDAIALAGGPTGDADLKKVRIVTKDGVGSQTVRINLGKYSETPVISRYIIKPEDNIFLPRRSDPFFDFGSLGDWVTVLGAITSVFVIREMLRNDNQRIF